MSLSLPPEPDRLEDSELLRRYVDAGSQESFAELVRRRIGLVYSVALRQVGGDRHRAEDATQIVFNDLARKAAALRRRPVLAGWLFHSARLAAAELVRAESRRRRREVEAHTMDVFSNEHARDEDWQKVRPVLDEALSEIDESDRDAIVLRFFDGRPFGEIGMRLRLSENTARMRVQRALDRLNVALARRGVQSTAGALGVALANQIGASAPAGLAATVAGTALAQGSAAATGWLAALAAAKLPLAAAGGIALVGGLGYAWQSRASADLRRELGELQQQQRAVAELRSENSRLAQNAAEVAALRHDDAEFKRLAQQVDDARRASAEKARVARAQANARTDLQAEIDRMNREGNALVIQYKALVAQGNDAKQSTEQRAIAMAAASQKLAEIQAKQREVQAFIAAARTSDPNFVPGRTTLRDAASVPGEISFFRKGSRAAANAAAGVPDPTTEPVRVSFSLPKADLTTVLSALEHTTGHKIIRDASLATVHGTIDFQAEKMTMPEAAKALGGALRAQLNVVLEPKADGTFIAKVPTQ